MSHIVQVYLMSHGTNHIIHTNTLVMPYSHLFLFEPCTKVYHGISPSRWCIMYPYQVMWQHYKMVPLLPWFPLCLSPEVCPWHSTVCTPDLSKRFIWQLVEGQIISFNRYARLICLHSYVMILWICVPSQIFRTHECIHDWNICINNSQLSYMYFHISYIFAKWTVLTKHLYYAAKE